MIVSDELTPRNIKTVLYCLGIEQKGNGWKTIKSPLREERNPSFGINLDTGAWKDHAAGDKGDIVTLAERVLNKDNTEAIQWIKEQTDLTGALYGPVKTNGHVTPAKKESKSFWTPARKKLWRKAKQRLKAEPNNSVIEIAAQRECLKYETLKAFHCGLLNGKEIGWSDSDWLLMPFETGAKLYLVNQQKDKSITPHWKENPDIKGPGSKPNLSFFGKDKATGNKKGLFIAKSPRETMLLYQLFGNRADVVGLATGEQSNLSTKQIEWLTGQISESNYSNMTVLLDCDSEAAKSTAKALATEIADTLASKFKGEVSYVNLHKASEGQFKDLTDCTRAGMSNGLLWDLVGNGNKVKATPATKASGNSLELEFDVSTAPPIPVAVYDYLPEMLKTRCSLIQEQHRKDVFLVSSLPAIAAQMPNVLAEHRDCHYSPDLFTLIVAGPGSGKGEASNGRALGRVTDKKIREEAEREIQDYESKPDEEKATTLKPKKRSLFVPANASSRRMLDRLEANGGSGFIFESEIDTLINATKQDWGNYTDTVRKSFQHEPVSIIRTDAEYYIDNPRLSICLTGTFDQFKAMFESAENGHFSRYALYTFDAPIKWESHRPTTKSKGLRESIKTASQDLYEMHQRLKKRGKNNPLYIDLTDSQWQMIDDTFAEKMQIIEDLGLSGHLHSSNKRTAIIALRLASIFAVLRTNEEYSHRLVLENSLTPTQADMNTAILLADNFIKHAIRLYYILPKSDSSNGRGEQYRMFISALPNQFETATAYKVANENDIDISERQIRRWLNSENSIIKIKKGYYEKRTS